MKFTKPTIIAGAIVTLIAGTGVAFAATDTFITKAPANDKPTRVWVQPVAETPVSDTTDQSSTTTDTPETDTTTPLVNSQTNNIEAPVANEVPTQNTPTPEATSPAQIENVTNVSNDNNPSSVSNNGEGVGVTHN